MPRSHFEVARLYRTPLWPLVLKILCVSYHAPLPDPLLDLPQDETPAPWRPASRPGGSAAP